MDRYLLDLGHGVVVRGSDISAVVPVFLMEWDSEAKLPAEPTCFVELSSGRVVPCFKPADELTDFIRKTQLGLNTW